MAKFSRRKSSSRRFVPARREEAEKPELIQATPLNWNVVRLQTGLLVAAVIIIYWPVLSGSWAWNDDADLSANASLHNLSGWWQAWLVPGTFPGYYPITATVLHGLWLVWGNHPLGYHLVLLALHLASSLLVWLLLHKLGLRWSWLGGFIFALHPAQVEAVALLSALGTMLAVPLSLLTLCACLDYEADKKLATYRRALAFFLAAMLCQASVAVLPLTILLYGWCRFGRVLMREVRASIPFFALAGLVVATTLFAALRYQQLNLELPDPVPIGGFYSRLALAGFCFAYYFIRFFWPMHLLPVYPHWPMEPPSAIYFLPWFVLVGVVIWLVVKNRKWSRAILLGLSLFLLLLVPYLGFVPLPTMSFTWIMDRFLYLPMIGLIGLVVGGVDRLSKRLSLPMQYGLGGILAVALFGLMAISHNYAEKFNSALTLWTYTAQRHPDLWMARNNLGYTLVQLGRLPEAIDQYQHSVDLNPDFAEARYSLGNALLHDGQSAAAMAQYREAIRINPNYADAHNNLGFLLLQANANQEAMAQYREVLRINPQYAGAYNNLGLALLQDGQVAEAINQINQGLQIEPNYIGARYSLGNALVQAGRYTDAIEQYEQVLQVEPNYADGHANLGVALAHIDQVPQAIHEFEEALRLDPHNIAAQNNLNNLCIAPHPADKGK